LKYPIFGFQVITCQLEWRHLKEVKRKGGEVSIGTACLDRESGGLGVQRVREFNVSLLGKWWWRMREGKEGLWFKVLVAKYEVED
jgi:hypothetical protein